MQQSSGSIGSLGPPSRGRRHYARGYNPRVGGAVPRYNRHSLTSGSAWLAQPLARCFNLDDHSDEAAVALNISAATVRRITNEGLLPASQLCKGAPWVIRIDDLARADIRRAADARRTRRPASCDPRQNEMAF